MKYNLITAILFVCCLLLQSGLAQEATTASPFTEIETVICSGIEDRQPVGESDRFDPDVGQVYLWTHCLGATDSTMVRHVWTHEGTEVASVELRVNSPSWRTWSSKQILPTWTGNWEVRVLDAGGNILKSVNFRVEKAPAAVEESDKPVEPPPDSL